MAKILPGSDLRNKYSEISNSLSRRKELHRLLDEGLSAMKLGGGRTAKEVFANIQKEYGFDGK